MCKLQIVPNSRKFLCINITIFCFLKKIELKLSKVLDIFNEQLLQKDGNLCILTPLWPLTYRVIWVSLARKIVCLVNLLSTLSQYLKPMSLMYWEDWSHWEKPDHSVTRSKIWHCITRMKSSSITGSEQQYSAFLQSWVES